MPSNEPDTTELPRYEDGDTTEKLPVVKPEEPAVRPPDRSGITVVVGSELYQDATSTTRNPYSAGDTARLPALRTPLTFRRLVHPLTSSRLVKGLLAGNALVLCMAFGLFIGGLWVANEAGVIPAVPGITQSEPKPEPAKTPEHKKEHRTPPATTNPGNWSPVAGPAASKPATSSNSPKASASASASPSASASAIAQPEASSSATPPASPETTAPATTPSASTPTPTESSPPVSEPTGSASDTATPPTGETASASPATADPTVTP